MCLLNAVSDVFGWTVRKLWPLKKNLFMHIIKIPGRRVMPGLVLDIAYY